MDKVQEKPKDLQRTSLLESTTYPYRHQFLQRWHRVEALTSQLNQQIKADGELQIPAWVFPADENEQRSCYQAFISDYDKEDGVDPRITPIKTGLIGATESTIHTAKLLTAARQDFSQMMTKLRQQKVPFITTEGKTIQVNALDLELRQINRTRLNHWKVARQVAIIEELIEYAAFYITEKKRTKRVTVNQLESLLTSMSQGPGTEAAWQKLKKLDTNKHYCILRPDIKKEIRVNYRNKQQQMCCKHYSTPILVLCNQPKDFPNKLKKIESLELPEKKRQKRPGQINQEDLLIPLLHLYSYYE